MSTGIRGEYEAQGVELYYATSGATYRNPHETAVRAIIAEATAAWRPDLGAVLDLACGSGEATLVLRELGAVSIDGIDPYTGEAYRARTGNRAEPLSFEDIACGALCGRHYTLIVCSFAMHLIAESWLPALLAQLGQIAGQMLIITPHKRPEIGSETGWEMIGEIRRERLRARLYGCRGQEERT